MGVADTSISPEALRLIMNSDDPGRVLREIEEKATGSVNTRFVRTSDELFEDAEKWKSGQKPVWAGETGHRGFAVRTNFNSLNIEHVHVAIPD